MSVVTNLILHMGIIEEEDEKIKEVNAFFDEHTKPLVSISDASLPRGWYGGDRHLECRLFVGAFNYFRLDDFIKHLRAIEWTSPEDLQLIIRGQHDTTFRIINVFSGDSYDELQENE